MRTPYQPVPSASVAVRSRSWRHFLLFACALAAGTYIRRDRTRSIVMRLISTYCLPFMTPFKPPPAATAFADWCDWETSEPAYGCTATNEADSPNLDMFTPDFFVACPRRAHTHVCHSDNATRAIAIGPFTSMPGRWHSIAVSYNDIVRPGDCIVGVTSDAVNATSGAPLTYPPLHLHHIHVGRGRRIHWHETHGDYQLVEGEGYSRHLPAGYCEKGTADERIARFLTTQINDVRYTVDSAMSVDTGHPTQPGKARDGASSGQHALPFYLRLVFRLAPPSTSPPPTRSGTGVTSLAASPSCRATTKFIWWYPFVVHASEDRLTRYPVSAHDAVWWWHYEVPRTLRILPPAWLHSHRARYGGLLLLRGNHTPESLRIRDPVSNSAACTNPPTDETIFDAAAMARVSTKLSGIRACVVRAAEATNSLVCSDDEAHSPSYVYTSPSADGALGGHYDRQGVVTCKSSKLTKGEPLTLLSFIAPRWNAHIDPFPQHTMLFFFADTNAPASELVEVLPPLYNVWELGNSTWSGSYREGMKVERQKTRRNTRAGNSQQSQITEPTLKRERANGRES